MSREQTWLENLMEQLQALPSWTKLTFCLMALGIILWGIICDYDWAIRWTNTARLQFFMAILGRDGVRILTSIVVVLAMLGLTYLYLD